MLVPTQCGLHNAWEQTPDCLRVGSELRAPVFHFRRGIFISWAVGDTTAQCCLVSSPDRRVFLCRHRADSPSHSAGPQRKPPPTGSTAGTHLPLASGAHRCPPHKSHVLSGPLRISDPAPVGCPSVRRTSWSSRWMVQWSLPPTARRGWN